MQTDEIISWVCQYCGEENELWLDLTVEDKQDFIEECSLCCRPNRLIITPSREEDETVFIESRLIDE